MLRTLLAVLAVSCIVLVSACGESVENDSAPSNGGGPAGVEIDPTPTKLDGTESTEFEADDIEAAESASDAVQEYCDGAVSEAQRVGCLAHVDESDLP